MPAPNFLIKAENIEFGYSCLFFPWLLLGFFFSVVKINRLMPDNFRFCVKFAKKKRNRERERERKI